MSSLTIDQFLEQEQHTGQIWDYVSPSRLSLWMKCPLAFRRRYIEGWQTHPSPTLFVGKVVHAVLAHIYQLRGAGQMCTADDLPRFVADAWKLALETDPPYFENEEQEEKSRYQVLDLVSAYFTTTPIHNEKPIAVEKRFEVPLIDPATGENLDIPLVGIVDLVLQEDGDNVLVDFKTSSTSSCCALQHELQLTAYAYLFSEATEQYESACEVRQLVKTKVPKILTYRFPSRTDEHFTRFFGVVREYLDAMDKGIFNYRPGFMCSMCENYGTCC
jgi:putative RecB family exonuclease